MNDFSAPAVVRRERRSRRSRAAVVGAAVTAIATIVTLTASSPSLATAPAVAAPSGALDAITFGDAASEQAHGLVADDTQVITGAAGQSARVARPLSPAGPRLGDRRFTMKVDPSMQNYLTLQLCGAVTTRRTGR